MSRTGRITLLVVAAVIAVGAFVLLQPAEQAETPTAATQTAPAPGSGATTTVRADEATTVQTTPSEPPPEPLPTLVSYRDGKAVGGVRKLEFEAGEQVEFRLRSDVAEEVHIHGYDKYVDLEPGRTRTVRFKGTLEGVFEVEMHGSGTPVAELRVSPS